MMVTYFLVLLALNYCSAFLNDACTAYLNPRRGLELIHVINVDICDAGQLYWDYPQGESKMAFRSSAGEFQVCLTPRTGLFKSYTRSDTNEKFDSSSDSDLCMKSKNQKLPLTVTASNMRRYVSNADFVVNML